MRINKIGAAALAASISFGGAALAFADDVMPADPTIEGETTTTTTVEDETEPTTTTAAVEDDGTEADGDGKVHPDNHGKIVSEAAHATPPGPGHGKAVSEVARSTNHGHTKGDRAAKPTKPKKAKAPDAGSE